jgi:hypothetical protein
MALFYLKLRRGEEQLPNDSEPEEHANLAEAKVEALEGLREIASNALLMGEAFGYTGIDITDLEGTVLARILAADALATR